MRNINKVPQRIGIFVFLFIVCAFGFASNNIIKTPLVMNVRAGNTRAAALALPFVPGGAGTALKTARAAGAATDLVAGAGEMVEGVKKGDVAQVALGALRMAGGAGQASSMAKAARGTTKSAADAGQAASSRRAAQGGAEEAASVRASAEAEVPEGIVYKRSNPESGEVYIGQTKSAERYRARQGEHDRSLGAQHEYEIVGRAEPGTDLDVLEETSIRESGGIEKRGGNLQNKRHQMSEQRYKEAGGTTPLPYEE